MNPKETLLEYLQYKSIYASKRTQEIYHSNLQKFFTYTDKEDITTIVMHDIYLFTKYLREEKMCKGATIANYVASLKSFFKYTKEMGYTELPYTLIKAPRFEEPTPEFVSEFEFDMIDKWLDENNYEAITKRLIFRLLWDTGARVNEVLGLNLGDMNIPGKFALIKRQKNMQKNVIMWSDETHELLVKYLGIRACMDYRIDALFISPRNCTGNGLIMRLNARSVQRWIKQICNQIDIEKNITPHSFRHGKAHKIMQKTGRQEDVKSILGHKSLFSSDKYTRLSIGEQSRLQKKYL